jgi:hypothetical protein
MNDDDWGDPFAEDEAARERERRRAEREARRQERRRALADKVREERAEEPPERPVPPPPRAPTRGVEAPAEPAPPRGFGIDPLWRRRILGLLALAIAGALVVFGAVKVLDRVGGSDDPAPAPAKKLGEVTIPEGLARPQIAEVAKDAGISGDYEKASRSFKGFDPAKYGAEDPDSLEGFLFPATYELPRKPKVEDLISRQLDAFRDNIAGVDFGYASSKNLTKYDVVIIASMIDREVQVPEERKLVAAVIYNRLHAGMQLQIDATVRYAIDNFTDPLSSEDLQVDSPYNTYANPGLPVGPIGNPGLDSIKAAAKPADVNYLYYVVKPNTCGEHTFAASEAQFERAKAAYDEARAANGGNAPTPPDCPS